MSVLKIAVLSNETGGVGVRHHALSAAKPIRQAALSSAARGAALSSQLREGITPQRPSGGGAQERASPSAPVPTPIFWLTAEPGHLAVHGQMLTSGCHDLPELSATNPASPPRICWGNRATPFFCL